MAIDVVLSTDEITVLGPPNIIDLSVNIGPQGNRGSYVFIGSGDPNNAGVLPSSITPQVYDVFINSASNSKYSWMYQYVAQPGSTTPTWEAALRLSPAIYASNISLSFNGSGIASKSILIADITPGSVISDANRYIVTLSPIGSDPVAWAINSKTVNVGGTPTLDLSIEAVKYSSSTWSALTGSVTWGIVVTMV